MKRFRLILVLFVLFAGQAFAQPGNRVGNNIFIPRDENPELKVTVKGYEFVEDKRKKVRKTYIVEAYNLTDVDATMAEILKVEPDLNDVQILGASLVTINDIFSHEDFYYKSEPKWYKCKVAIIDGETEKTTKKIGSGYNKLNDYILY